MVYRKAAIMPINRATRVENIIVFVTNQWEELVDLINDPAAYMKSQQFLFKQQDLAHYVEWQVLAPATASLQCGGSDPLACYATAQMMQDYPHVADFLNRNKTPDNVLYAEEFAAIVPGVFHVEFATYTTYLKVTYYPPKGNPLPFYTGKFDRPVLVMTSRGVNSGTIHVDIDPSARGRAQVAASIAQDPKWLIERLAAENFEIQQAHLVTAGHVLPPSEVVDPSRSPAVGTFLLPHGLTRYSMYLDILASGLSDVHSGTFNCHQIPVTGSWASGLTLNQCNLVTYQSTLFEPHVAIPRVMAEFNAGDNRLD